MRSLVSVFLIILVGSCFQSSAQDTLKYWDGTSQVVKVEELTKTSIRYKKFERPDGPSYSIAVGQISAIVYRNGTKDVFTRPAMPQPRTDYKTNMSTNEPVQNYDPEQPAQATIKTLRFGGPRLGCTYLGPGSAADWIEDQGKTPFVSQIGWQLETRIFTSASKIAGLVELEALLGGMEQGMFLPSANLLIGLRSREGLEFSMGPNVSYTGLGMSFALSTCFQYQDVTFPVSLSYVPSIKQAETIVYYNGSQSTVNTQTGHRITLLIGFNIQKK